MLSLAGCRLQELECTRMCRSKPAERKKWLYFSVHITHTHTHPPPHPHIFKEYWKKGLLPTYTLCTWQQKSGTCTGTVVHKIVTLIFFSFLFIYLFFFLIVCNSRSCTWHRQLYPLLHIFLWFNYVSEEIGNQIGLFEVVPAKFQLHNFSKDYLDLHCRPMLDSKGLKPSQIGQDTIKDLWYNPSVWSVCNVCGTAYEWKANTAGLAIFNFFFFLNQKIRFIW